MFQRKIPQACGSDAECITENPLSGYKLVDDPAYA